MADLLTNDSHRRTRRSRGKLPGLEITSRRLSPIPILVETLSAEERNDVRNGVRARRLNAVQRLLRQPDNICGQDYLLALHRIMVASPERMIQVVDRWPVGFLLERLCNSPELAERVFCRLIADLLFVPGDKNGSPLRGCTVKIPTEEEGRLPCLSQNGYLVLGVYEGNQNQIIRCEAHSAAFDDPLDKLEFRLPLHRDIPETGVTFVPFETSSKWNKPIVNIASMVLIESPGALTRPSERFARPHVMPLNRSLAEAYEILHAVLPQVLPWVDLLIPSFVRIESTGEPGFRLSGSFGPSSPIYLSEVSDSFHHAEDIVHELQHELFLFYLAKEQCFGRWNDQQFFVSPYRDDPRPLRGLHLGLHALIAVNEFRLRALEVIPFSSARMAEMAVIHRKNLFAAMSVLQNESPTPAGESYFSEIVKTLSCHHEAILELASKRMLADAVGFVREHINKVAGLEPAVRNGFVKWASIQPADLQLRMTRGHR
jgi:HEXXH motif-containing protein